MLILHKKESDKMEKEKLPQYVIDEIEKTKNGIIIKNDKPFIIYQMLYKYHDYKLSKKTTEWLRTGKNEEKLIKAIMNGYEVEKEQLYYIKLFDEIWCFFNVSDKGDVIGTNGKYQNEYYQTKFTLEEIKQID